MNCINKCEPHFKKMIFFGSFITIDKITNEIQSQPRSQPNNRRQPNTLKRQVQRTSEEQIKSAEMLEINSDTTLDKNKPIDDYIVSEEIKQETNYNQLANVVVDDKDLKNLKEDLSFEEKNRSLELKDVE